MSLLSMPPGSHMERSKPWQLAGAGADDFHITERNRTRDYVRTATPPSGRLVSVDTFPSSLSRTNSNSSGSHGRRQLSICTALFDYEAQGEDELSLQRGQVVEILSKDAKISGDEGWWTGKIGDKVIIFSTNLQT